MAVISQREKCSAWYEKERGREGERERERKGKRKRHSVAYEK